MDIPQWELKSIDILLIELPFFIYGGVAIYLFFFLFLFLPLFFLVDPRNQIASHSATCLKKRCQPGGRRGCGGAARV